MYTQSKKLEALNDIVGRYSMSEQWIRNSLLSLSLRWNDKLYAVVAQHIASRVEEVGELPLLFKLPESQDQIDGELLLGRTLGNHNLDVCASIDSLPLHVAGVGSPGFGKSTLAVTIAEQAHLNGISSIFINDPKADEYIQFCKKYESVLYLSPKQLSFNVLTPPLNCPLENWLQLVVGHMSQCFNFWEGGESYLLRILTKLLEEDKLATLNDALEFIKSEQRFSSSKDQHIRSTISSRLELLNHALGNSINTESRMLEQLSNRMYVLSTTSLMSEIESYLLEFMFLQDYTYRVYNPEKRLLSLRIYDECHHRLFSAEKERNVKKISSSIISQLVNQCRVMKQCLCTFSQEPSSLIKSILNAAGFKACFRLGSSLEINAMIGAMGLSEEQASSIFHLEPGEAIVRMSSGYCEPFPVKFDQFVSTIRVSDEDFWRHQELLREKLYNDSEIINTTGSSNSRQSFNSRDDNKYDSQSPDSVPNRKRDSNDPLSHSDTTKEHINLLHIWLNLPHPFLVQGDIFRKAGIVSGSKQAKTKRKLLSMGFIDEYILQIGRGRVSIWEPTISAYGALDKLKPQFHSKGGYLHQFVSHHVEKWAKSNGYEIDVEFLLTNNKAIDQVHRKEHELVFVEIEISSSNQAIVNIIKDSQTMLRPSKMIVIARDSKLKKKIEGLVSSSDIVSEIPYEIIVTLAGDYIHTKLN